LLQKNNIRARIIEATELKKKAISINISVMLVWLRFWPVKSLMLLIELVPTKPLILGLI